MLRYIPLARAFFQLFYVLGDCSAEFLPESRF